MCRLLLAALLSTGFLLWSLASVSGLLTEDAFLGGYSRVESYTCEVHDVIDTVNNTTPGACAMACTSHGSCEAFVYIRALGSSVQWPWLTHSDECGPAYPNAAGNASQCNPASAHPCCSGSKRCGGNNTHCNCPTCIDYRTINGSFRTMANPGDVCGSTLTVLTRDRKFYSNNPYENFENCSLVLKAPDGYVLTMTFSDVYIINGDYLKIYDGPSKDAPLLQRLEGTTQGTTLSTSSNVAYLNFISDTELLKNKGFVLSYDKSPITRSGKEFCPYGWWEFGESCYYFSQGLTTYETAQSSCRNMAAHLADVSSTDEHTFISRHATVKPGEAFWIGLKYQQGTYYWWDQKPLMLHTSLWASSAEHGNDTCAVMDRQFNFKWTTRHCSSAFHFICELEGVTCNKLLPLPSNPGIFADSRPWIEMDFNDIVTVAAIDSTGDGNSGSYTRAYSLEYSEDGYEYFTYSEEADADSCPRTKIIHANDDAATTVRNFLRPALNARYLRIVPVAWHVRPAINPSALGCEAAIMTGPGDELDGLIYIKGSGHHAFSFSDAERHCASLRGELATPDQLRAAFDSGYERAEMVWLRDGSVRYPVQLPGPEKSSNRQLVNMGYPDKLTTTFDGFCYQKRSERSRLYKSLGCWQDVWYRTIPTLEGTDPRLDGYYLYRVNAIEKCYQVALSRGFTVFALQHGGWCAGSADAKNTYNDYGPSTACAADGEGGPGVNAVYEMQITGVNVALGKTAFQTSILNGGYASLPVDGNTNTHYSAWSCSHTASQAYPSWWVDLGQSYMVVSVVIFNRRDCCPERLNPFNIHIGDSDQVSTNPQCGGDHQIGLSEDSISVSCQGMKGRYVAVRLPGPYRVLTLCEVQVFSAGCEKQDYTYHDGYCYKAVSTNLDFQAAEEHCAAEDAWLAFPRDADTNQFLLDYINASFAHNNVWLGLDSRRQELKWMTNDGLTFTDSVFTAWDAEEPDSEQGKCARISHIDRLWDVRDCSNQYRFVCQRVNDVAPWWLVDLERQWGIDRVTVVNSLVFKPERINPFNIHIGDSRDILVNPKCGENHVFVNPDTQTELTISCNGMRGRYVAIRLQEYQVLRLAEIEMTARSGVSATAADQAYFDYFTLVPVVTDFVQITVLTVYSQNNNGFLEVQFITAFPEDSELNYALGRFREKKNTSSPVGHRTLSLTASLVQCATACLEGILSPCYSFNYFHGDHTCQLTDHLTNGADAVPSVDSDFYHLSVQKLCQVGDGVSYRVTVSVTETGKTCQRWDSQTPHGHDTTPTNYPSSGLDENYCRNTGNRTGVWCYTTDPSTRWELCDVPVCRVSARAPVGLWPLNARYRASDVTGNGNGGTATGTQLAPGPYGHANGAFQFSGTANSYIDIPNNGKLDVRYSYTILAHIFPTGYGGPIFDYVGNNNWAVHFWQNSGVFLRSMRRDGYSVPHAVANVLQQNAWNYVGGRYDNTTGMASVWNNGELVHETYIGVAEVASQYPIRVGVRHANPPYYAGRIACLQLYNYAMTEAQIAAARDECEVVDHAHYLHTEEVQDDSVTLAWDAPTAPLLGYRLVVYPSYDPRLVINVSLHGDSVTVAVDDLVPETIYIAKLFTFGHEGEGASTDIIFLTDSDSIDWMINEDSESAPSELSDSDSFIDEDSSESSYGSTDQGLGADDFSSAHFEMGDVQLKNMDDEQSSGAVLFEETDHAEDEADNTKLCEESVKAFQAASSSVRGIDGIKVLSQIGALVVADCPNLPHEAKKRSIIEKTRGIIDGLVSTMKNGLVLGGPPAVVSAGGVTVMVQRTRANKLEERLIEMEGVSLLFPSGKALIPARPPSLVDAKIVVYRNNPFTWGGGERAVQSVVCDLSLLPLRAPWHTFDDMKEDILLKFHTDPSKIETQLYEFSPLGTSGMTYHQINITDEDMVIVRVQAANKSSVSTLADVLEEPTKDGVLLVDDQSNKNITRYYVYSFGVQRIRCSFWDEEREIWSSHGCQVHPTTSITETVCACNHMTPFGSDFATAPNSIDFNTVFSKFADLDKNSAVFSAVLVVLGLFLIAVVFARRKDIADLKKWCYRFLPDNRAADQYYYHITVHTGHVVRAGTESNVAFNVIGDEVETGVRIFGQDSQIFKKGSVNTFSMAVRGRLGEIRRLQIWHDNKGGRSRSWYLEKVILQDLQTRDRCVFICNDWLSVDRGDGQVYRNLTPAKEEDLSSFSFLFSSSVRTDLKNEHLWYSIISRPTKSYFTRVQRLSCGLCVLYTTMVSNAMWYKTDDNLQTTTIVNLGPISFTLHDLYVSVMTSVTVVPVNLLLIQLFKRCKPKTEENKVSDTNGQKDQSSTSASRQLMLPHWCVYVGWLLLCLACFVAAFFTILYSLEWGSVKANNWLKTFLLSFFQSTFVFEPVKIIVLAIILSKLFKKMTLTTVLGEDTAFHAAPTDVHYAKSHFDRFELEGFYCRKPLEMGTRNPPSRTFPEDSVQCRAPKVA
ncbi:PKD1L3 [Branchiostoma lanceolatum]|uniref:PKD1L3 protein n=1 Tax=Branchiostoma lanceolatum TaxID=7740 RepID=A0A8J9ZEH2_BRALA|nr:PKD1L3 [Branchiostoma lanceolatum]